MKIKKDQKVEILLYRHSDLSKLLQSMTNSDLRIFSGILTMQLVLGGFLTQVNLSFESKIGVFIIDCIIAITFIFLLNNHNNRRSEVVNELKNCNKALGFNKEGVYLDNLPLSVKTKRRPWLIIYIISIIMTLIGIGIILFLQ